MKSVYRKKVQEKKDKDVLAHKISLTNSSWICIHWR